jgi:dipeptidyl aminopeptidase/acylaminoacyl peptidase
MASDVSSRPLWEQRFLAPTRMFPVWSRFAPERAVYLSDEDGSFQAYAWDIASDTHRRLSNEEVGVDLATISADGSQVIWFSDPTGDESGRWIAVPFEGGDFRDVLPGAPIGWPEGLALGRRLVAGVIADRDGFAVYLSENGDEAKEIHRDVDLVTIGGTDFHIEGWDVGGLSSDDSLLCVTVAQAGDNIRRALRVLDTATGAVVGELADGEGFALEAFAWSPVQGDRRMLGSSEKTGFAGPTIWNPTTGERTDLDVDLPGEVVPVDWFPDASAILVAHVFRGRDRLYRLELETGTLTEIPGSEGEVHGARVRPDGTVWFRVSTGDEASRVLDDRGDEVLATPPGGVRTGRPYRDWSFTNADGDQVHGWLVLPEKGEAPYPTYMKVHGGPSWLYLDTWWPDVQLMLDLGFAVGMVNYRGWTGYGRVHRDHIIGNIGFPEVADTVAGYDDLVRRGIADPSRSVIAGWSWGGYTTLLALGTYPDRFAAGVAGVPVGDYAGSYDDSAPALQAYDRTLVGGTVHELPEFVAERSPITYVGEVKVPVLVLVGENDTRCVPAQVYSYVDALKAAGGDVEVYSYGTGHSSYVVEEELRQWRAVADFLQRTVLNRP